MCLLGYEGNKASLHDLLQALDHDIVEIERSTKDLEAEPDYGLKPGLPHAAIMQAFRETRGLCNSVKVVVQQYKGDAAFGLCLTCVLETKHAESLKCDGSHRKRKR